MPFSRLTRGHLCLAMAAMLWSMGGAIIKSIDVHPYAIAFYRNIFAAAGFALFLKRSSWAFAPQLPFCVVAYAVCVATYLLAMAVTTAANAIFLQYTWPIFVFVITVGILREKADKRNLGALALGMIGVGVIFAGRGGADDTLGIVLGMSSGLAFAVLAILLNRLRKLDSLYVTFMCNLGGAVVLLPFAWSHLEIGMRGLAAVAFMGWFQLGLGFLFFTYGVKTVSPQESGIITLLEPVFNPLWVALVVHELPNVWTMVGGALILAALALRYSLMADRAAPEPPLHVD